MGGEGELSMSLQVPMQNSQARCVKRSPLENYNKNGYEKKFYTSFSLFLPKNIIHGNMKYKVIKYYGISVFFFMKSVFYVKLIMKNYIFVELNYT